MIVYVSGKVAGKSPKIKPEDAVAVAEGKLNATFDKTTLPAPKLEYLAKQDGSASLTYVVQVRNAEAFTWYEAFVDAHTGELASVTDFSADAKVNRCLPRDYNAGELIPTFSQYRE